MYGGLRSTRVRWPSHAPPGSCVAGGSTTGAGGGRPGARYSGGIWTSTTVVAVAGMVEEVVVDGARQPRDVSVKERGVLGCIVGLVDAVEVDSGSGRLVDAIVASLDAVLP